MIFTIFFITFFNMPTVFLIIPWVIGVPFMAAIKINDETPLSMVLDSGKLKLPDGRVLTGDFTIAYREKWTNTYFEIVTGAFIPFS